MSEKQSENDLFYVCSLLEYIARKTNNKKKYIVEHIGKERINKLFNLAEIYHSENIDKVSDEIIKVSNIEKGNYKLNLIEDKPTYWDIGRVYQRLIIMIDDNKETFINNLLKVMNSWIIEKIDDYNSNLYYENPGYIYECYMEGKIL